MQSDIVTTYIDLRKKLISEKAELENRLQRIAQALDQAPAPARIPGKPPRRGRKPGKLKTVTPVAKPKRRLSPEGRRRIIEATKARWAKLRGQKAATPVQAVTPVKVATPVKPAKTVKPVKRRMSKAARAKMAAAAKARWAKAKAAGKNQL